MTMAPRRHPLLLLAGIAIPLVRRHPYAAVSIAVHVVLLALLLRFGIHVDVRQQQERQVGASVQLTARARTEKRVQDMEKIKSLLEQSAGKAAGDADKGAREGEDDDVQFSATTLPRQPREVLDEAKALSRSIDALERDIKAGELARIQRIPKDKALEQVDVRPPLPESAAASGPSDPAKVAAEVERLEARARETLMARQQDLERQEDGVQVAGTAGPDPGRPAREPRTGQTGQGGQQRPGGGESASANASGMNGAMAKGGGAGGTEAQGGANAGGVSRARGRIAAFINRDAPVAKNGSRDYNRSDEEIFDLGIGSIPPIPAGAMSKGSGRLFGAGGEFADRMQVDGWYLIGPFDGKHGREMFSNDSYPPEQGVLLDAVYFGKGKRLLKWQYVSGQRYPLVPPDDVEDAVYYGYTELMMDEARDLTLWIGADDDVQVWLNDRMVWAGGNVNKKWFFDQVYDTRNNLFGDMNANEGKRLVHFRKGRNKVFFKLSNGPNGSFLSMVLTK